MIRVGDTVCPDCGGELRYKDSVRRILRGRNGVARWIVIRRLICCRCGSVHRELPANVIPYRQYDARVVHYFTNGTLTTDDENYEDYPTDLTVALWKKAKLKKKRHNK